MQNFSVALHVAILKKAIEYIAALNVELSYVMAVLLTDIVLHVDKKE